jgi:hypothetical protein
LLCESELTLQLLILFLLDARVKYQG